MINTPPSIKTITDMPPDTFQKFKVLFNRFCHDLDSAFERADTEYSKHMPSKGDVCEAAVAKYLSDSLGSRYSTITNGHAFDSNGTQSKELDVVIFDDYWSGRLTPKDSGEPPIIPIESVYAVIEVKKTLSSTELRGAIENIRSFKSLQRERVGPDYVTPNKNIQSLGYPGTRDVRNPYFGAIFAYSAGRSMKTVLDQLKREVDKIQPEDRPDVVIVYKDGVILPYCETCKRSSPYVAQIAREGHNPEYILDSLDGTNSLLGFHFLLVGHLHYTILVPPKFEKFYSYLAHIARSKNL